MRTKEHIPKPAIPLQAGRFATFGGLLRGQGSGAPVGVLAAVALVCAFAAGLLFSVASAHAETCVNEAFRQGPSADLPECRVYEMVSPVYEGGNGAEGISAIAPDGESVAFQSKGAFAGLPSDFSVENQYMARRSATGWSTAPLQLPGYEGGVGDFSATLESVLLTEALVDGEPAPNSGTQSAHEYQFMLHQTDLPDTLANWGAAGDVVRPLDEIGAPTEMGASADFCHIVVEQSGGPYLPEAVGAEKQLYDIATGCAGERSLSLVAVRNRLGLHEESALINAKCQPVLGESKGFDDEQPANFNDVSADGGEIFFTTNVEKLLSKNGEGCDTGTRQLFVRMGDARTLEVSRPLEASKPFGGCTGGGVEGEVPCRGATERASAYFKGASEDGSRVFFTTRASLVSGDSDTQNDLYMATIGCPATEEGCVPAGKQVTSLAQVSHDPNLGEAAEVQGVVRVASDGGRAYFVAHGVLSERANAEGQAPVKDADNLYVYDTETGKTAFIADLCSGPANSGETPDRQCSPELDKEKLGRNDMTLWTSRQEAQSTPDGEYLVFASFGQLVKGDTDTAKDVYRYDASTGALDRVSLGEGGYDANGNENDREVEVIGVNEARHKQIGNEADATIAPVGIGPGETVRDQDESQVRTISEDGSRIVFSTAAPLSPRAVNGLVNIYEWHKEPAWGEGVVSMISSGNALHSDIQPVISPSGRDIFFITFQGLAPQDTLGDPDVYDARIGGGFAPVPAPVEPCDGDACQGPLTDPAPLLVPGSVSRAPGENFAPAVSTKATSPKKATLKCSKGKTLSRGKCIKTKRRAKKKAKGKAGNERRNKS